MEYSHVKLLEAKRASQIHLHYKKYQNDGGSGSAGVEKFPRKTLSKDVVCSGRNIEMFIHYGKIKCGFDLVVKKGIDVEQVLDILMNSLRLFFDERHLDREPFCYINLDNFAIYEIGNKRVDKKGNSVVPLKLVLNGVVKDNTFFNVNQRHLLWFEKYGVKIYDSAINRANTGMTKEDEEIVSSLVENNRVSLSMMFKDTTSRGFLNNEVTKSLYESYNKKQQALFAYNYLLSSINDDYSIIIMDLAEVIRSGG